MFESTMAAAMSHSSTPSALIVTTATEGYAHWMQHLHRNLILLGLERNLRVCAGDTATAALAASLGIGVVTPELDLDANNASSPSGRQHRQHGRVTLLQNASNTLRSSIRAATVSQRGKATSGETFMSAAWTSAVHFKQRCVWRILERSAAGTAILLVDGDLTLFKDPLPILSAATTSTFDLAVLDDTKPGQELTNRYLNSGFVWLRNTAATRAFGRAYLAQLGRRRAANDQTVFNDVLYCLSGSSGVRKPSVKEGHDKCHGLSLKKPDDGLRLHVLDSRRFLCGYLFYEYRRRRPLNASDVVAVHHNWIKGDRNKWQRAVAYDTVLQDPTEPLRHFLRRAKLSMVRMQEWQYRNRSHPGNNK